MIVVDTSVVVAFMNRGDGHHDVVRDWIEEAEEEFFTTPLAIAEMDHLVLRYAGLPAAQALWRDLERGAYQVEWWPTAVRETVAIAKRYAPLEIGLTDASLVALAARLDTEHIATLDERHFRQVKPKGSPAFTLLPADLSDAP